MNFKQNFAKHPLNFSGFSELEFLSKIQFFKKNIMDEYFFLNHMNFGV